MLQRLVGEGGGVVLLQPFLNVNAVLRVAVGGDDGVVHQSALERHVLQLLCNKKREVSGGGRAGVQRTRRIGKGNMGEICGRHFLLRKDKLSPLQVPPLMLQGGWCGMGA